MYNRNRIGPRTERCSTADGVELDADDRRHCVQPAKYEVNHDMTTPSRPYDLCNRLSVCVVTTLDLFTNAL